MFGDLKRAESFAQSTATMLDCTVSCAIYIVHSAHSKADELLSTWIYTRLVRAHSQTGDTGSIDVSSYVEVQPSAVM